MLPPVLTILLGTLVLSFSYAQKPTVHFDLGFSGEFVSGRWNPVRVELRDINEAELEIHIDQGSLLTGELPMVYRARLPGGNGLSVFKDDLYIPTWRQLSWLIKSGKNTLASGSFNPQERSSSPLDIIVSVHPGRWRSFYDSSSRVLETDPGRLPKRLAAYNGVRSLLIDGTSEPPQLEAIAAAAASGVKVILNTPLPNSHNNLSLLATSPIKRLGAGWIIVNGKKTPDEFRTFLSFQNGLNGALFFERIVGAIEHPAQRGAPPLLLLVVLAIYSLLTLFFLRLGNAVAIISTLALGLVFSLGAWVLLPPETPRLTSTLSLTICGGELAANLRFHSIYNRPGGELNLDLVGHPIEDRSYVVSPSNIRFSLERGERTTIFAKPILSPAPLVWQGGSLINTGSESLSNVYVNGFGMQDNELLPEFALVPANKSTTDPPSLYLDLENHLPKGTAFALAGRHLIIALPTETDISMPPHENSKEP